MKLITEITTIDDPIVTTSANRFRTNALKVNWDIEVKDVLLIDSLTQNKTLSEQSAINLGYKVVTLEMFSSSWNTKNREFVLINPNTDVSWVNSVINMNCSLGGTYVARILNHMLAWDYCIKAGKPVIVLEAGSVINTPIHEHLPRNSIIDINNKELHYVNSNWACLKGIDCYGIDQFVAKKLFNHILDQGIRDPLHLMLRDDLFTIRHL